MSKVGEVKTMPIPPSGSPRVVFYYDATCGLCVRSARWVQAVDRRGRVQFLALDSPGALAALGITQQQAQATAWVMRGTERLRGAGAVNAVLDALVSAHFRGFSAIYRVPGIRFLEDRAYRWVAEHRHLFPGARSWCDGQRGVCAR